MDSQTSRSHGTKREGYKREAASPSTMETREKEKRTCVSMACMPCRNRRSKCDAVMPTCGSCRVHNTEAACHYNPDKDLRTKGALRKLLVDYGKEKRTSDFILRSISQGSEADAAAVVQLLRNNNKPENYSDIQDQVARMLHSGGNIEVLSRPIPSGESEPMSALTLDASQTTSSQSRHYGATSNLAFQGEEAGLSTNGPAGEVPNWTTVTSDTELIDHLLKVYFTWSHPFHVLFSEECFHHGMDEKQRKYKYCTPLLMNAILAIGCCYSDRPEARKNPKDADTVGDHFFDEAQRLFAEVPDEASLPIVQALGLMSLRETMHNRVSSGRKYVSLMSGMVAELGLERPPTPDRRISDAEVEARKITFWGSFALETASAMWLGRTPSPLKPTGLGTPKLTPDLENVLWRPFGTPNYDGGETELAQPSRKYGVLLQLCLLSGIVNDFLIDFYSSPSGLTFEQSCLHYEKLQKWRLDLPTALQIKDDGITLPQIITLHCYYHHCVIVLLRPFLNPSSPHTSKSARGLCDEAAGKISQLMDIYSRTYGLDKSSFINSNSLTSAAIIHVFSVSKPIGSLEQKQQTEVYLAEAIQKLHEMKADRFLRIVQNVLFKWRTNVPASVQPALDEAQLDSTTTTGGYAFDSTIFAEDGGDMWAMEWERSMFLQE